MLGVRPAARGIFAKPRAPYGDIKRKCRLRPCRYSRARGVHDQCHGESSAACGAVILTGPIFAWARGKAGARHQCTPSAEQPRDEISWQRRVVFAAATADNASLHGACNLVAIFAPAAFFRAA